MQYEIPDEYKLELYTKVIAAKNIQTDEPILGAFDEYGEPIPAGLTVIGLRRYETIESISGYKIVFNQSSVIENFLNNNVIVTIPFVAYIRVKTNYRYRVLTVPFVFKRTIPIYEFLKPDGTPLTVEEFEKQVDQSIVVVENYSMAYIDILPKVGYRQRIELVLTATVIDNLGKDGNVIVYGYVNEF